MVGEIIGSLLLAAVVFLVLFTGWVTVLNIYKIFAAIGNFLFDDVINRNLIFTKIKPAYKFFLERKFTYYKKLDGRNKKVFERRVQKFIRMKTFEVRGSLQKVTPEMKALIAASAIQITFGLPSIYLAQFHTIIIYPEAFYSTTSDEYHRGEVNTRGFIVLSWNNFLQGYLNDSDGRNLGLHEMAHALKVADAMGQEESDFFDRDTFHKFIHFARLEMQKIAAGDESFFRAYAATNDQEFFAVAVENFFERSEMFFRYNPELYQSLRELLNQNPIRSQNPIE
jgi:MtfA peptidase